MRVAEMEAPSDRRFHSLKISAEIFFFSSIIKVNLCSVNPSKSGLYIYIYIYILVNNNWQLSGVTLFCHVLRLRSCCFNKLLASVCTRTRLFSLYNNHSAPSISRRPPESKLLDPNIFYSSLHYPEKNE